MQAFCVHTNWCCVCFSGDHERCHRSRACFRDAGSYSSHWNSTMPPPPAAGGVQVRNSPSVSWSLRQWESLIILKVMEALQLIACYSLTGEKKQATAQTCELRSCAFVCMLFVSARQRDGVWGVRLRVSGWILGTLKQTFLSHTLPDLLEVNHSS